MGGPFGGRVVRGFELRWWLLAEFFGVAEDLRKISRIVQVSHEATSVSHEVGRRDEESPSLNRKELAKCFEI